MAKYTQINPDGSRVEIHYNPHHDGPASELLIKRNRVRFLTRKVADNPFSPNWKRELARAQHILSKAERRFSVSSKSVSRQPKRAGISASPETRGKQPNSRSVGGVPVRLHNGPSNGQGTVQREENATVPITHGSPDGRTRESGLTTAPSQPSNADLVAHSSASPDVQTVDLNCRQCTASRV